MSALKPFFVSLPLAVLLTSVCYGQTTRHGGKLRTGWTQIPIQENGDVLDIVLKPVQGMDWIVGIKVKADGQNALSFGDGSRGILYQVATGERTGPPRIAAHAADQILASGSTVSISGGVSHQILIAYLELKSPLSPTIHDGTGFGWLRAREGRNGDWK